MTYDIQNVSFVLITILSLNFLWLLKKPSTNNWNETIASVIYKGGNIYYPKIIEQERVACLYYYFSQFMTLEIIWTAN